jgi:hypothetical protein
VFKSQIPDTDPYLPLLALSPEAGLALLDCGLIQKQKLLKPSVSTGGELERKPRGSTSSRQQAECLGLQTSESRILWESRHPTPVSASIHLHVLGWDWAWLLVPPSHACF